jgi:hypothetical protein
MEYVTIIVALAFSVLVLVLRPTHALAAYLTAILCWPNYLSVNASGINVTVGRIVVAVLFVRCLCDEKIKSRFAWSRLDKWVALSMAIYVGIYCSSIPLSISLENRAGFLTDTWLAYLVARFCITSRRDFLTVVKWAAVVLAPLAILGVIESVTGWRAFGFLTRGSSVFTYLTGYKGRMGYLRAMGPFSHPILFGCNFAMFLPLIFCLRRERGDWKSWAYILSLTVACGALSSMSSGAWVMVMAVVCCLLMEKHRHLVKPTIAVFLLACATIQVVSNRPFYHVLASWANVVGGAGWHRSKLIDVAIEHFDEWWLIGYGLKEPGWGPSLGMSRTDAPNEFIWTGLRYGVLGILVLCGVLYVAISGVVAAYRKTRAPQLRTMYWSMGTGLFSVILCWMAASLFGQLQSTFYCILGMIASSLSFAQAKEGLLNAGVITGQLSYAGIREQ